MKILSKDNKLYILNGNSIRISKKTLRKKLKKDKKDFQDYENQSLQTHRKGGEKFVLQLPAIGKGFNIMSDELYRNGRNLPTVTFVEKWKKYNTRLNCLLLGRSSRWATKKKVLNIVKKQKFVKK